jgi:hypothetical protein
MVKLGPDVRVMADGTLYWARSASGGFAIAGLWEYLGWLILVLFFM